MRTAHKPRKTTESMPVLHPDAAGLDIGAREVYAAVPYDRSPEPLRCFGTFTEDLHKLADWLGECQVRTVALEATGVYWIPVFQILETRGFEVNLVNARYVKNVQGRKSDWQDCQWIQYLQSVGLLAGSFRPPDEVCALRVILRHRMTLVGAASTHVQHMQKSLTQMNLQLHHVISDITGKTGLAILEAILAGERDPAVLAKLRDPRIKAPEEIILKSLVGDWRKEHLFTLKQALQAYKHCLRQIAECDAEIETYLGDMESSPDTDESPPPAPGAKEKCKARALQLPTMDLRTEMRRILGVDLTEIDGIGASSAHAIFAELGSDLSSFRTAKHFVSWLGLCPDNKVSGGKRLSVGTRRIKNRVANTLRLCAQALHHSTSALGAYYRSMRSKLGAPKAITATAHKLARIVYHLMTTKTPYNESVFARDEEAYQARRLQKVIRDAKSFGFTLAPMEPVS